MADDATKPQSTPDPLDNLKAEFNRKLSNTDAEIKKLSDTNSKLLQQIQEMVKPKQAPNTQPIGKKLDDIFYENPEEHARIIKDQAKKEILEEVRRENQGRDRTTSAINAAYSEYPELQDPNHPLTKKTVEIYNSYSDEDKADPKTIRLASLQAAQELEVKPRSKRPQNTDEGGYAGDDGFSSGYSGGNSDRPRRTRRDELAPETLEFAQMMGFDVEKPETVERLKDRAKRVNYRRTK